MQGHVVSAPASKHLYAELDRLGGFLVVRGPDGALAFRRPDGRPLPEVPAPATVPGDPVTELKQGHDAQGLAIHARTACPSWLGEGLNVGYAIDVLHPLAQGGPASLDRSGPGR